MTGVDITLTHKQKRFNKSVEVPFTNALPLLVFKMASVKGFATGLGKEALNEAHDNAYKIMKVWQRQSK